LKNKYCLYIIIPIRFLLTFPRILWCVMGETLFPVSHNTPYITHHRGKGSIYM